MRLRDRLLPVLTVTVAAALAVGAERAADYVGSMNSARVLGAWLSGMHRQSHEAAGGEPLDTPAPPSPEELRQQVGTVEVVVIAWRWSVRITAGLLWLTAVVGAWTGSPRRSQLVAAGLLILSTILTLTGLAVLTRPQWGGMDPLPTATYVLVGAVQSCYAWVLLIAFARRPGGTALLETPQPPQ